MKNCRQCGRQPPWPIAFCDLPAATEEKIKFQNGRQLYALIVLLVSVP